MIKIEAVALDVDGVLTDGSFWWGPGGEEYKRFSFTDVMGVSIGIKAGMRFTLISGEDVDQVDRYASKMGIVDVYKGCKDKATALRSFAEKNGIDLAHICYMGDDVNDLPAMKLAGLVAAPANAHTSVKSIADIVTQRSGGDGAVREVIDMILSSKT
ncbi:MAG: HAD hydrolase family protein [Armatimonadota bacterium]|nr:HAD hydrolase family protein [Armatimonadota bacterium]